MEGLVYEANSKEQLLEYLRKNDVAVIVWNQTGGAVCAHCKELLKELPEGGALPAPADADSLLRERIARELVFMGFRRGQAGFNNIVEAIGIIARLEPGVQIRVTSDIYPQVAKHQHSTVRSVERTIRNAIESVWKRSNLHTLQEMYPYPCDNQSGRPTNAEFLINMAGKFHR